MKLLGPAACCIEFAGEYEKEKGKAFVVFGCGGVSRACLIEDVRGLRLGAREGGAAVEPVVGKARACRMEVIMTFA